MNKLIEENLYLVKTAISQLHCKFDNEDEWQEWYQIGCLGLVKGARTLDTTISIKKWLMLNIKQEILRQFKYNTVKGRDLKALSLNKLINEDIEAIELIPDDYNLEEEILKLDKKELAHKLLNRLKNRQYKTFLYEYYGIDTPQLNQIEIAQKYGVSNQLVQQQIKRGLKHLRKEIEKYDIKIED